MPIRDYPDIDAEEINRLQNTIRIDSFDFSAHTNLYHSEQTPIQTWNFILKSSQHPDLPKLTFSIAKEIPTNLLDLLEHIKENARFAIRELSFSYDKLTKVIELHPNFIFKAESLIKPLFLYINKTKTKQPFYATFINKSPTGTKPLIFTLKPKYIHSQPNDTTGRLIGIDLSGSLSGGLTGGLTGSLTGTPRHAPAMRPMSHPVITATQGEGTSIQAQSYQGMANELLQLTIEAQRLGLNPIYINPITIERPRTP